MEGALGRRSRSKATYDSVTCLGSELHFRGTYHLYPEESPRITDVSGCGNLIHKPAAF